MTRYRGALLSRAGDNLPRSRSTHTPLHTHSRAPRLRGLSSASTLNTSAFRPWLSSVSSYLSDMLPSHPKPSCADEHVPKQSSNGRCQTCRLDLALFCTWTQAQVLLSQRIPMRILGSSIAVAKMEIPAVSCRFYATAWKLHT